MFHQLTRSLLPIVATAEDIKGDDSSNLVVELNDEQTSATSVENGPLLLEAGPGTGKTRALIGRVRVLLTRGVKPEAILALTFSNQAAEEMRERLSRIAPDAVGRIWIGTFHAFGLELLRKYGHFLGLPARPTILDPIEALFLLERLLPSLQLNYYQNLYEPTANLSHMLQAISRAKDELVDPVAYSQLADEMRTNAVTEKEIEVAERAQEVARVYSIYQTQIEQEGVLDFADLINRAIILLRSQETLSLEIRRTYTHVLVDEYQDVNRASVLLLKELAGSGSGLWVVGDKRQSIYRFRGAAPRNMDLFAEDFPGANTLYLKRNYRSQPPIVDLFSAFAPTMQAVRDPSFQSWQSHRPTTDGQVRMEIATDQETEIQGIATAIQQRFAEGIAYRDQAVLCRSHGELTQVATVLTSLGIPTLSFGAFFERSEIRDLLSLLSLACHGNRSGLVRVAQFPEYRVPIEDVQRILALVKSERLTVLQLLDRVSDLGGMSDSGKASLTLLAQHLKDICYGVNPWQFLMLYLFERSNYIRSLFSSSEVEYQQRCLAVFQFLQFVYQHRHISDETNSDPKRLFLKYVRRIKQLGGDKELRHLPASSTTLDAVRLLTIHGSKGLEFNTVFVPFLGRGKLPARRQGSSCPPPTGMLVEDPVQQHSEEEECLFFVALSRAQDFLCLSRAKRYGQKGSNASELLTALKAHLPYAPDGEATWASQSPPSVLPAAFPLPISSPTYTVVQLDLYLKCPRAYYYEFILELDGQRDDTVYRQFYHCVNTVMRWMREPGADGQLPSLKAVENHFEEVWSAKGTVGHAFEALYKEQALLILNRFHNSSANSILPTVVQDWDIALPHGTVRLRPDDIEIKEEENRSITRIRRHRTGRATSSEKDKDIYALYQHGAELAYPNTERQIEISYLSTGETETLNMTPDKVKQRLAAYDDAIVGIEARSFTPTPNDHRCARCRHFVICPAPESI